MTTFTRGEPGAGIAAGVGTVYFMGDSATNAQASPMVSPGMPINTVLRIDGGEHRVSHDIRASLLETLRAHFGRGGTNQSCDHGQCGGCTVHVDGKPRLSCLTLTVAVQGADITTPAGDPDAQLRALSAHPTECVRLSSNDC